MAWQIKITVDRTKVAADAADYPLFISGANMPDEFWSNVKADGSDIWLSLADGTKLKRELVGIDTAAHTMELYVKCSLSASVDTVIYLNYGDSSLTETNDADTWDDNYSLVMHLRADELWPLDSTVNDNDSIKPLPLADISNSGVIGVHQGVAWDGTYYYAVHTTSVKKFDANWNLIATNTDIIARAREILVEEDGNLYDHIGDGAVYDGTLYIPLQYYLAGSTSSERIVTVRTSDLVVTGCVDVSAQAVGVDGLYADADYVYAVQYANTAKDKIQKYNRADLTYANADITLSTGLAYMQGITCDGAHWYITAYEQYVYLFSLDGTAAGQIYNFGTEGDVEGLQWMTETNQLAVLHDTSGDGTAGIVHFLGVSTQAGKCGDAAYFNGAGDYLRINANDLHGDNAYTLEVWAKPDAGSIDGVNRRCLYEASSGSNYVMSMEIASAAPRDWRSYCSITSATLTTTENALAVENQWDWMATRVWKADSTMNLYLYRDGTQIDTDTNASNYDLQAYSYLNIGTYRDPAGLPRWFKGLIDELRISKVDRGADYITTTYNNQNSPETFYSVQLWQIPADEGGLQVGAFDAAWR